jgi:cell division transport system permease protein
MVLGDVQADRVVPPTGFTAQLTVVAAAAMAFLAVFALALSMAAGRLADRWGDELARTSTVRVVAPQEQRSAQTQAVMRILETTSGVAFARVLDDAEQRDLLAPWFGNDLDLSVLPVPRLIEVVEEAEGFDAAGLRLRLAAEVPGAVLDDHTRWREPLVRTAGRLRFLGLLATGLIVVTTAVIVTLAAQAALSATTQVIAVLRLVGATDAYIEQAFIRRFTLRALAGAAAGTALGAIAVWLLPAASDTVGILTGLGLQGAGWALVLLIPVMAAAVAFVATGKAARRTLSRMS